MTDSTDKPRRPSAIYWILLLALLFILGISIFLNVGLGIALSLTSSGKTDEETAVDEHPTFDEEWSYGSGDVKVVRMELTGFITRESEAGFFEPPNDKIEDLIRAIRAATNDDEVKAIILEIDSPGGGITPSDEVYDALARFKNSDDGRKVVIFMRDLTASGGYYVAMAGDWLIAQPTTIVGSIGVIMQSLNWKSLSERIGITDTTIKSGENKDLLNPFRESDPAQIAMLQEVIDLLHARFRELVSANRGLDAAALDTLADGRIFSSGQALELKLVDQIGYWPDVIAKTAELLGVEKIKVVRYYQTHGFWDYFTKSRLPAGLNSRLWSPGPARLQYLWQP